MSDEDVHTRIEQLVAEEHQLWARAEAGAAEPDDKERLAAIKVALDQAWDLLRQRRALREAGLDPAGAHVRDGQVVERYEQ